MEKMYKERFVVAADGIRLYCRDYPNPSARPPVLCLPGLTRNSRDFSMLAGRLSATRRVICPDLRGRGNSEYDPDWRNYHPGRYSEDLWQLLDELDVAETVVIGTSLGGWMAMLLNPAARTHRCRGDERYRSGSRSGRNRAGYLDRRAPRGGQ
jgi:pimeloyl-ACP methyl ester carboxylesterase